MRISRLDRMYYSPYLSYNTIVNLNINTSLLNFSGLMAGHVFNDTKVDH